jgi:hypothetical protein
VRAYSFTRGAIAPLRLVKPVSADGLAARAADDVIGPLHDPALEPRDEAVFLLTVAAEIEHALMVQYLYAAYSVHVTGPNVLELQKVKDLLLQIAREEMGHLATVQNLLHLVGGPLNLGRDQAPYANEIYPFRFALEPVTLGSLAKYVTAESPGELPDDMADEDKKLVDRIRREATAANDGNEVRHVGRIFERLAVLFGDTDDSVSDEDFRTDTAALQATAADMGFDPLNPLNGAPLVIESFPGSDVAQLRGAARAAVLEIAEQGEGFDLPPAGGPPTATESHFERFLDIYKRVSALIDVEDAVSWPVATNPNTTPEPVTEPAADPIGSAIEALDTAGRITEPRALAWAQLFNLRYRLLLSQLGHFLRLDQEIYRSEAGPQEGDRTARGLLLVGVFDEMRHLAKIAGKLVQLPKDAGAAGALHAGPPFELPYTLNLPDGERYRWRMHLDASRACTSLLTTRLDPDTDPFLAALLAHDTETQTVLGALAAGDPIPAGSLPTGFAKAVTILQEAVRGFHIAKHGNFWAGKKRDDFVSTPIRMVGSTPLALDDDGAVVTDPAQSPLIQRLVAADIRRRMPRFRPPVPPARIAYLKRWISDGAPDDDPPEQVGVVVEPDAAVEPIEPPPGALSFAADIVGLFRVDIDRESMLFKFDLLRFEDVRDHADAILARLEDGSMPCDQPWRPERTALFRRWRDEGRRP